MTAWLREAMFRMRWLASLTSPDMRLWTWASRSIKLLAVRDRLVAKVTLALETARRRVSSEGSWVAKVRLS